MQTINPQPAQFSSFMKQETNGPIVMLNLLKYKPEGGRESYAKYGELAAPHLKKAGGKIVYHGSARATVIGPDEEDWDTIILVEYPNKAAFHAMITDPEYQALSEHRTAALDDSRLVCTQRDERSSI